MVATPDATVESPEALAAWDKVTQSKYVTEAAETIAVVPNGVVSWISKLIKLIPGVGYLPDSVWKKFDDSVAWVNRKTQDGLESVLGLVSGSWLAGISNFFSDTEASVAGTAASALHLKSEHGDLGKALLGDGFSKEIQQALQNLKGDDILSKDKLAAAIRRGVQEANNSGSALMHDVTNPMSQWWDKLIGNTPEVENLAGQTGIGVHREVFHAYMVEAQEKLGRIPIDTELTSMRQRAAQLASDISGVPLNEARDGIKAGPHGGMYAAAEAELAAIKQGKVVIPKLNFSPTDVDPNAPQSPSPVPNAGADSVASRDGGKSSGSGTRPS